MRGWMQTVCNLMDSDYFGFCNCFICFYCYRKVFLNFVCFDFVFFLCNKSKRESPSEITLSTKSPFYHFHAIFAVERIAITSASVMLRIGTDTADGGVAAEPDPLLLESTRDNLTHNWSETQS